MLLLFTIILVFALPVSVWGATITVDTGVNQGALRYGGIGFLYGLARYTPSDEMITGLIRPQYTGQNAPNGGQHPDGYCDEVAAQAVRTGFKGIYICMQDIYAGWPYPNYGINDYLEKVETIARTIVNHPNRSFFIYSIFNEPDLMWYSNSGYGLTQMCNHWKLCYDKIKSIDPTAKIMGPGFAMYHKQAYTTFFNFAQNNNCLPDICSWHELTDNFFTSFYDNYNHFRSINSATASMPININEYGRPEDLAHPGNLIQFLARFENTKVDGCLAYWTGHGTLNDLVANDNTNQQAIGSSFNKPTGAWYLYRWYGQMTGHQVKLTPPSQNGPLQGIASKNGDNVSVIFGGGYTNQTFDVELVVTGLSGNTVNYTVWETQYTGRNPAPEPSTKTMGTVAVVNGTARISVPNCFWSSAYRAEITPGSAVTYYRLRNRATGLYLDGMGRYGYGDSCGQWGDSNHYNQHWELISQWGYYRLRNRATGLYLDGMGRYGYGEDCGQWGDSNHYNQQWELIPQGGYYRLKNRATGLFLDGMRRTANGSNCGQWGDSNHYNQQWLLQSVN